MNKLLSTVAFVGATMLALPALAAHTVTWVDMANVPLDPRPCIFFQVDGQNTWYALPASHPSFDYEKAMLLTSKTIGDNTFDFWIGPGVANCSNVPEAYQIQLH